MNNIPRNQSHTCGKYLLFMRNHFISKLSKYIVRLSWDEDTWIKEYEEMKDAGTWVIENDYDKLLIFYVKLSFCCCWR